MNDVMRSVSYGHNLDHVRLCVLKSKIWLLGWNIQIGINFYQSWSNVQIKFCDFNKFKNWLTVWNFQFIKTGHGFGRTKHFGVPQFGNFAWLVKYCSWLSWATIIGYLLHHFSYQRTILENSISITMFRTASFQICDRDPFLINDFLIKKRVISNKLFTKLFLKVT